jgi:esterase/lipase
MQHLLLLHGAIGSKEQLQPLAQALQDKFIVHSFNFSGHGGQAFSVNPFSISLFSNEIMEYLEEKKIPEVHVFGYSMGGYAAMYLAKEHPGKIARIITLATKYHWDESIAAKEVKMLDAATIQEKVPAFAAQLQQRHAPNDWKELLDKTKQLLTGLGKQNALQPADYASITIPALILLGDRDKMVTIDETINVYKQLPSGKLGILPGTPHPLEQVDISLLTHLITGFLE